jgi:hypothetical protein
MRFLLVETEVPAAVSMMATVVWAVAPFTIVDRPQSFRGPSCLHLQGKGSSEVLVPVYQLAGLTSRKTVRPTNSLLFYQ